jgi:glucosylceramidase
MGKLICNGILVLLPLLGYSQQVTVYVTTDSGDNKISKTASVSFSPMPQPVETQTCVFVDRGKTFQTFNGIGGAITDAAAETFYKMPQQKQKEFLTAYYNGADGIGYTVARTNINSCDFSSDTYAYVTDSTDRQLNTFSIDHDKKFKLPLIKAAIAATGGNLHLFASPWSPPAFMKTNGETLHGGKLRNDWYSGWALYYTKFIKAYRHEGVPVWGITIQNEPMATQTWESCIYTAGEEHRFLKNYLGPTMWKEGLKDVKIMAWDHNRDLLYQRAAELLADKEAAKYLWGIAYHWYEDWSGGEQMYENVKRVNQSFPGKALFFTEGCNSPFQYNEMNDWKWAEKYAESMINDFNSGTTGFTDWNILLDEKGGPNHVGNFCYAPVHYNTQTGELIFTKAFYAIGQFSKFIQPGAKRIAVAPSRSRLLATGFRNPDGKIVVIVLNRAADSTVFYLWMNGNAAQITAWPHSVTTIIF